MIIVAKKGIVYEKDLFKKTVACLSDNERKAYKLKNRLNVTMEFKYGK